MYPKSDYLKSLCKVSQKGKEEREDTLQAATGERRVVLQPGERSGVERLRQVAWIGILGRAGSQAQTKQVQLKMPCPSSVTEAYTSLKLARVPVEIRVDSQGNHTGFPGALNFSRIQQFYINLCRDGESP